MDPQVDLKAGFSGASRDAQTVLKYVRETRDWNASHNTARVRIKKITNIGYDHLKLEAPCARDPG